MIQPLMYEATLIEVGRGPDGLPMAVFEVIATKERVMLPMSTERSKHLGGYLYERFRLTIDGPP